MKGEPSKTPRAGEGQLNAGGLTPSPPLRRGFLPTCRTTLHVAKCSATADSVQQTRSRDPVVSV